MATKLLDKKGNNSIKLKCNGHYHYRRRLVVEGLKDVCYSYHNGLDDDHCHFDDDDDYDEVHRSGPWLIKCAPIKQA